MENKCTAASSTQFAASYLLCSFPPFSVFRHSGGSIFRLFIPVFCILFSLFRRARSPTAQNMFSSPEEYLSVLSLEAFALPFSPSFRLSRCSLAPELYSPAMYAELLSRTPSSKTSSARLCQNLFKQTLAMTCT